MSVVEKSAPRRRIVVIAVGVVVAVVAAVAVVLSVGGDSSPSTVPPSAPSSTVGPSSTASARATAAMRIAPIAIDRDFAGVSIFVDGDDFVGTWRDHAIVAEYFPERTSFHEYRVDGSEARSVALVGRRPDVVGGIVRDSVVVERAGRVLLVGLADATVREFAVGNLLGVGGDRIFFTSCTTQATCTINEATLDGMVRATPIGSYVDPESGAVIAQVAPDGSALVVFEPQSGREVVLEGGTRLPLSAEGGPRSYTWAPSGRRLFYVDETADQLDIIDYRAGRVATVPPGALAFYTRRGGSVSEMFVRGSGCDRCGRTGYLGRTGVFEVLPLTDEVVRELLAGADPARIREIALAEGLHTLTQHAVQLVAAQTTTIDEIRRTL